jgi:spermidine/putrescine-binding protein
MAWAMGLAVDRRRGDPPESWRALWDDGATGTLALPRGLDGALPDIAARLLFGTVAPLATSEGAAAAAAHVGRLAPRTGLWWRDPGEAEAALAAGRVAVAMLRHVPAAATRAGALRTAVPAEGGPLVCAFWCRPMGGAAPDAAGAFIEAAADPSTQGTLARALGVMPVVDFAAAGLSVETFAEVAVARPIRPAYETGLCAGDPLTLAWRAMLRGAIAAV